MREARLNTQHTFLKLMVYDGRLIFDECVKLAPGSTVLDSGTGTGIEFKYDTIDISSDVMSRCMGTGPC